MVFANLTCRPEEFVSMRSVEATRNSMLEGVVGGAAKLLIVLLALLGFSVIVFLVHISRAREFPDRDIHHPPPPVGDVHEYLLGLRRREAQRWSRADAVFSLAMDISPISTFVFGLCGCALLHVIPVSLHTPRAAVAVGILYLVCLAWWLP